MTPYGVWRRTSGGTPSRVVRAHHATWTTGDSALCRTSARRHRALLGPGPSLHHLRRGPLGPPCSAASQVLCPSSTPSPTCMTGLCLWLPGPIHQYCDGCRRGLSVLARAVSRRAYGSGTTPGLLVTRDNATRSVAFQIGAHGWRPEFVFRSSIPRPSMPLSTLHPAPRVTQRKTRGQDGSLLLSCGALSSPTARRFIPTLALHDCRGSVWPGRSRGS